MVRRATAAIIALAVGSCLEPLPEPVPCDREDQFILDSGECETCASPNEIVDGRCVVCPVVGPPATQCFPEVGQVATMNGCIAVGDDYDAFECLTGKLGAAAFDECEGFGPTPALDACFAPRPSGAPRCPPEVAVLGDAACFPLSAEDIAIVDDPALETCVCRAADRLARCDGVGVILAGVGRESDPTPVAFAPIGITLPGGLPEQGRFGVYVRARGFSVPFLIEDVDASTLELRSAWAFFVTKGYDSLLGFGLDQDGIPLTEGLEAGLAYGPGIAAPPRVLIIAQQEFTGGVEQASIVELDCVIPFVIRD